MNLTREEILALPAGPQLDSLICENVSEMAWVNNGNVAVLIPKKDVGFWLENKLFGGMQEGRGPALLPAGGSINYSTELDAAWGLFAGKGWILFNNLQSDPYPWAVFANERALADWRPLGLGQTAPLAICRAALLALAPAPTPATEGAREL